ncbi:group II truncated hemoglobin [Haliea sp. E17]|uniref:group II truncated hemoglobin n=1 Tax=Haliea sp. E17 TaxID=3401576 RepID=UPI003AADD047
MNQPSTPYQILGEDGIRQLTSAFYDLMDELPEVAELRALHARDLAPMKTKLAEYLIGWMGGPPLYAQKYGGVCMTEPHAPYAIGPALRDQWLFCMERALERTGASEELREMLKVPLFRIADAIRNRDKDPGDNPDLIASV